MNQLLLEQGIPQATISALVHGGCTTIDDLQCWFFLFAFVSD